MGSSSSKPLKATGKKKKPAKSSISRPVPQHTPLSYQSLEPMPFRPLPHHPAVTRRTHEQEIADRYRHFFPPEQQRPQKPEAAYRGRGRTAAVPAPLAAQVSRPKPKQQQRQQKKKAPYQFKPLNDIGAPASAKKRKNVPAPRETVRGRVLPPIPPMSPFQLNMRQSKQSHKAAPAPTPKGKKPQPRFGGTRQDKHGEWWVLVLADGKWHRSRDMGLKPPVW